MKILWYLPLLLVACNTAANHKSVDKEPATSEQVNVPDRNISQEFKDYWYAGTAEISSYNLQQARYGEMRNGTAVMVFVTEPMDAQAQVKADANKTTNRPVLKLNATRNFNTGVYPYTMMSSTFLPLDKKDNALKIAASIQEWCGHTYMQFNNKGTNYDIALHSYFQSEGDVQVAIPNEITENQLPAQLRLDPLAMPVGDLNIIPSAEFLRLKHVKIASYPATASLETLETTYVYKVLFTSLNRTVTYTVDKTFPYQITTWTDAYNDGREMMTSTATLINTIQSAYWNKNSNADANLRKELGL